MKTNGKLTFNQKEDLLKFLIEQDVMQLRLRLNEVHITIENEPGNYKMNTNKDSINFL